MANVNSNMLRNNLVQSLTMSGNLTWAKADFKGKFTVFLSATGVTRTLTISNTGFVAGDFLCLLINQNSSASVNISIGTSNYTGNRGNIVQAIYDGTTWIIWSGGGVTTSSTANTITSFGLACEIVGVSSHGFGFSSQTTDNDASVFGRSSIAGLGGSAYGRSSNASSYGLSLSSYANSNNFVRHNSIGAYSRGRRYGSTRLHLGTTTSTTDATNPSQNKEWATWNGTTANATITEIFLRGVSSNRCVLQANNAISFKGQAVAFLSNYTGSARWDIEGLIKRNNGNNTTLVGVTTTLTHSDGTGNTLVLTIDADDTNESLRVQVTGNASETWTWLVELELLDLRIA